MAQNNMLKNYLKDKKISQAAFAHMLGVHQNTMGRYLKNESEIPGAIKKLIFHSTHGEVNLLK